jgi:hypothetical protein
MTPAEETRRAVLAEMHPARELAVLAGRAAEQMLTGLQQWKAESRIFSVEHEGTEYFPFYALDPDADYQPYPVMAEVIRILRQTQGWSGSWALAGWLIGLNSFLDDQRPRDLLALDPAWVIESARDAAETERQP